MEVNQESHFFAGLSIHGVSRFFWGQFVLPPGRELGVTRARERKVAQSVSLKQTQGKTHLFHVGHCSKDFTRLT